MKREGFGIGRKDADSINGTARYIVFAELLKADLDEGVEFDDLVRVAKWTRQELAEYLAELTTDGLVRKCPSPSLERGMATTYYAIVPGRWLTWTVLGRE